MGGLIVGGNPSLSVPKSARGGSSSPQSNFDPPKEVKEWGGLVGWCRLKGYTAEFVRDILEKVEAKEYIPKGGSDGDNNENNENNENKEGSDTKGKGKGNDKK